MTRFVEPATVPTGDDAGTGAPPVRVWVYWDYACPFSYVGERRLARLRERIAGPDAPGMTVAWRPMEIHTGVPEEGIPVKEMGWSPDRWSTIVESLEAMAAETGVELRVPSVVPSSTAALHGALLARDVGEEAFRRYHRAVFRSVYVEGRNIGDREVLLDVADGAGLDREALARALEDRRYADELREARGEADRYDVTGTPTFFFGRFKVVGAAPVAVLREALDRARGDRSEPETR